MTLRRSEREQVSERAQEQEPVAPAPLALEPEEQVPVPGRAWARAQAAREQVPTLRAPGREREQTPALQG